LKVNNERFNIFVVAQVLKKYLNLKYTNYFIAEFMKTTTIFHPDAGKSAQTFKPLYHYDSFVQPSPIYTSASQA
jgi:hypothetical protein